MFRTAQVAMKPTTMFDLHSGYSPELMGMNFPPSIDDLRIGIDKNYHRVKAYETADQYPHDIVVGSLQGQRFATDSRRFKIVSVKAHPIVNNVYGIGDVEMNARLLLGPLAGAVAAYPYVGKGTAEDANAMKTKGDGAATQAMRAALMSHWMRGEIRGGEGGGRDDMGRGAALYMGEQVGTGYGFKIHFIVDPLEVTNATKVLAPNAAWANVGQGWSPKLNNPNNWYPGYSGASSIMLAVNASQKPVRPLSDFLYLDKLQVHHKLARELLSNGGTSLPLAPEDLIRAASAAFRKPANQLRCAALARSRHLRSMRGWMKAGVESWNMHTPSDGDALFAPALASNSLHFAGLTGGVMEGIFSTAVGIPMGVRSSLQFVSHDQLSEKKDIADLLQDEQRFGFSDREYAQMLQTRLYDSQHIGQTLRTVRPSGRLAEAIKNSAWHRHDMRQWSGDMVRQFLDRYDEVLKRAEGARFTKDQRRFLKEVLENLGFLDVRRTLQFSDFVPSRDWLAVTAAITPNKWAPLDGIQADGNQLHVDLLVVGGSNAVYGLEVAVEEI